VVLGLLAVLGGTAARAQEAEGPVPDRLPPSELDALKARVSALEEQVAQAQATAGEADLQSLVEAHEEPRLQLYGFMETGLQRFHSAAESQRALLPSNATSFVFGRTNVYLDARPLPRFRGLIETRLTLLPHGMDLFSRPGPLERANTTILDSTSPSGREEILWSGLMIERAQLEYTHSDLVNVQAGYFLTPWGIWNVDHGTPTLIALMLPTFLVQNAVPMRQLGAMLYGSLALPPFEVGYRAYVSNGRTTGQFDLSEDKAFGGRLFLRRQGTLSFLLGLSGFTGTTEDQTKTIRVDQDLNVSIERTLTWRHRERTFGLDLSLDLGGFRLRAEGVQRHVRYEAGRHQPNITRPGTFAPNRYEHYAYAILAYRFGRVEPYVYLEAGDTGQSTTVLPDKGSARSGGLNLYLTPASQIKTQLMRSSFRNLTGRHDVTLFTLRWVLAF
jgi:hypothetical protein